MTPRECESCGRTFAPQRRRTRFCSRDCAGVTPHVPEDIWKFIEIGDPAKCWRWLGTIDSYGYGRMSIARSGKLAHRIAFELGTGRCAGGLLVCHHCDNRWCCNPAHLFLGSPADNLADAAAKGRMRRGEDAARARLTTEQVLEIRHRLSRGAPQKVLAAQYGVTQPNISAIGRRATWRHV